MSRIAKAFAENSKTKFIAYITAGDPHPDMTVGFMHDLVETGVDVIELGVPFSDPLADGVVIQKASDRALATGVNMTKIFNMVAAFRETNSHTPVILMGYLNPIEVLGYEACAKSAKQAGVDGFLVVDLPVNQADDLHIVLKSYELDMIFLISPTSTDERIELVAAKGSGFVYYVSLKGITGANNLDVELVAAKLKMLKRQISIPIAVGFGISTPQQVAALNHKCDGVVVGSALVKIIAANSQEPQAEIQRKLSEVSKSFTQALV